MTAFGEAVSQLFFPHHCVACHTEILSRETELCWHCLGSLPSTHFANLSANPIEKIFWGRLPIQAATALYFYTQDSILQRAMHQLKYHGNRKLGMQLGRLLGEELIRSERFDADLLIPVPLHPLRQRQRGYNQASIICEGMSQVMKLPVLEGHLVRSQVSETQTNKNRMDRWANIRGRFAIQDADALKEKHCLLVDDVITTGATLEACGSVLAALTDVKISIACIGTASQ